MWEPNWFVRSGKIDSVGALGRAARSVDRHNGNAFSNARFELRPASVSPLIKPWRWNDNPFIGTRELAGLKIMNMLLSNWDAKDARLPGPNTLVLRVKKDDGAEELQYLISDWGAAMGRWGGVVTREKWSCRDFSSQTPDFVKGVSGGRVKFGFTGKHAEEIGGDIKVEDVRWLMQYLGRITDAQLRAGLAASGAAPNEVECFANALRARIEQLRRVADGPQISQR
jgi:hypothetical protein